MFSRSFTIGGYVAVAASAAILCGGTSPRRRASASAAPPPPSLSNAIDNSAVLKPRSKEDSSSTVPMVVLETAEAEVEAGTAIPTSAAAATAASSPDLSHTFPHGIPGGSRGRLILVKPGHVLEYDTRTRQALWSCESLSSSNVRSERNRKHSTFYEDADIDERFRARLEDYRGSGYDRGHLAPAGNALSQEAMDATFALSNISPQVGEGFNRHYWARIEHLVRQFQLNFDRVSVCTGPLFLASIDPSTGHSTLRVRLLGVPPSVWVPTHFFKVILGERLMPNGQKEFRFAAFIVPNAYIPDEVPLETFEVTKEEVERAAGFAFFEQAGVISTRICEDAKVCALPSPNFWEARKQQQKSLPASQIRP